MKNLISTILFCVLSTGVFSQTLTNTNWELSFPDGTSNGFVNFSSDTLYRSTDGINFSPLSVFQENIDSFIINDIDPSFTSCGTPGSYTFVITNDTLDFTLISDTCTVRINSIANSTWIRNLSTKIEDVETAASLIKVYPNPTSGTFFIESTINNRNSPFIIFNKLGQQVLSGQLTNEIHLINTDEIPKGLYYIQIGEEKKQTKMIIKQ
jgi:hypothetical protein